MYAYVCMHLYEYAYDSNIYMMAPSIFMMRVAVSACMYAYVCMHLYKYEYDAPYQFLKYSERWGLGSRPKKMYGERLGDGVEYHLMSPTLHC